jgi:hypothetical protein
MCETTLAQSQCFPFLPWEALRFAPDIGVASRVCASAPTRLQWHVFRSSWPRALPSDIPLKLCGVFLKRGYPEIWWFISLSSWSRLATCHSLGHPRFLDKPSSAESETSVNGPLWFLKPGGLWRLDQRTRKGYSQIHWRIIMFLFDPCLNFERKPFGENWFLWIQSFFKSRTLSSQKFVLQDCNVKLWKASVSLWEQQRAWRLIE